MRKCIRRKYKMVRGEFKKELYVKCQDNKALAMLLLKTYTAWHHRRHIGHIWEMFIDPAHSNFHKAYNEQLFGKHLTGTDDIWRSLYFADKELYVKYCGKIPENLAMGDALSVAYQVLKQ